MTSPKVSCDEGFIEGAMAPIEPMEHIEALEPTEIIEPMESTEIMEPIQPIEPTETVERPTDPNESHPYLLYLVSYIAFLMSVLYFFTYCACWYNKDIGQTAIAYAIACTLVLILFSKPINRRRFPWSQHILFHHTLGMSLVAGSLFVQTPRQQLIGLFATNIAKEAQKMSVGLQVNNIASYNDQSFTQRQLTNLGKALDDMIPSSNGERKFADLGINCAHLAGVNGTSTIELRARIGYDTFANGVANAREYFHLYQTDDGIQLVSVADGRHLLDYY